MKYIEPFPDLLPPMAELAAIQKSRPLGWQGLEAHWQVCETDREPVFIDCFNFADYAGPSPVAMLFGFQNKISNLEVGGVSLGDGYFIEYVIMEYAGDKLVGPHRLLQRNSICYSEEVDSSEIWDYAPADRVRVSGARPRWPHDGLNWPLLNGEPMSFVWQKTLRETEVTRQYLTWDTELFVYTAKRSDGSNAFKLLTEAIEEPKA